MRVGRRELFRRGAALAAAAGALPFVFARRARAQGFGALVADPDGVMDLPEGFSYAILEEQGGTMSDGYRVPNRPDGMAAFPGPNGTLILLRNHELADESGQGPYGQNQSPPAEAYDDDRLGGVTRLVVDGTTFARVSSNLVLVGTSRNCSGGPSPWGWLSCEEAVTSGHGYVFRCPTDASSVRAPERIVEYGRFNHEAVAIDPVTNAAYLTEDRPNGCLYRFLPDDPEAPFVGKFQALGIQGEPGFSTVTGLEVGQVLNVTWIDIADSDPSSDTLRTTAVADGAAVIYRGEGIFESEGVIYFSATLGGDAGLGQVFALRPTTTGGTLTLVAESEDADELNGPDNLTMSPWGDLIIAEDGTRPYRYIRALTPSGELYDIGRTDLGELCGVTMSPDGRALFVNIQQPGLTLVITGPFVPSPPDDGGTDGGSSAGNGGSGGGSGSGNGGAGGSGSGTGGSENGGSGGSGMGNDDGGGGPGGESGGGEGGATGTAGNATAGGSAGSSMGSGGSSGSGTGGGGIAGSVGTSNGGAGSGGTSGAPGGGAGRPPARPPVSDDTGGCGCRLSSRTR